MSEERNELNLVTGSEVMVIGGNPAIRGCIGTVTDASAGGNYAKVQIPEHGEHICHKDQMLIQNART